MIKTTTGDAFVDGITLDVQTKFKYDLDEVADGTFYVVDNNGEPTQATTAYVYGPIVACCLTQVELVGTATYTIKGTCKPVYSMVYVSPTPEKITAAALKDTAVKSVRSSVLNGSFTLSNVTGIDGSACIWITVPTLSVLNGSVTCTSVEVASNNTEGTELLVQPILLSPLFDSSCTNCGGTGMVESATCTTCGGDGVVTNAYSNPTYTITGSCSAEGSTIRLTYVDNSDAAVSTSDPLYSDSNYEYNDTDGKLTRDALTSASVAASTTVTNGSFSFDTTIVYDGLYKVYAVWTTPQSGNTLDVNSITVTDGSSTEPSTCLSANAPITMADGTYRKMEDMRVGDIVMAENGEITTVRKLARGAFNPYHILYHFEDGTIVDETHDHRFYNVEQGFWQYLKNWKIGEHAISQNGEHVALESIVRIDEPAEAFGLWTEHGTFYAHGLLSGETACNEHLLANATPEQALDMIMSLSESKMLELLGLEGALP